jgi:alkylation response protein AidB-like acyl-CoA dehydrogenase
MERAMILNSLPGLDFGLGSDINMLRDTVGSFAQGEIAPCAADINRSNKFPRELWPQLGALGLLGITVEEEWAVRDWATSLTAWRWRRFRARRRRSVCPTARTQTSASIRSGGTATTSRRSAICPS